MAGQQPIALEPQAVLAAISPMLRALGDIPSMAQVQRSDGPSAYAASAFDARLREASADAAIAAARMRERLENLEHAIRQGIADLAAVDDSVREAAVEIESGMEEITTAAATATAVDSVTTRSTSQGAW